VKYTHFVVAELEVEAKFQVPSLAKVGWPRLSKERGYFLMARPLLLCQGGEFRSPDAIKCVYFPGL